VTGLWRFCVCRINNGVWTMWQPRTLSQYILKFPFLVVIYYPILMLHGRPSRLVVQQRAK
jgi:hypothetical protein